MLCFKNVNYLIITSKTYRFQIKKKNNNKKHIYHVLYNHIYNMYETLFCNNNKCVCIIHYTYERKIVFYFYCDLLLLKNFNIEKLIFYFILKSFSSCMNHHKKDSNEVCRLYKNNDSRSYNMMFIFIFSSIIFFQHLFNNNTSEY